VRLWVRTSGYPLSPRSHQHPRETRPRVRVRREPVDDVGPALPVLVPAAHQLGGDRVAVGSKTRERFARTPDVTEHAPRGRDTSRNSPVPLGASESPRSELGPAVSVPRHHATTTGRGTRDLLARKVVPGNFTTGLVSSRYLGFGVSQIPRRHRQFAFPPIPTGTPSRLTALARSVPCFDLFGRLGPISNLTSNPRTGQTRSTSTYAL
jgi:hypothetical protein